MKSTYSWLVFCVSFLMAGCVPVPAKKALPEPAPAPVIVIRADNEILAYALQYGALPAEEQKKEYTQVLQAYEADKINMGNRMKAALVLSLPASRQRDNARALAILDEVQRDNDADQDTKAIAALLKEYVSERQKLEENAAKLSHKANDERKRVEALQLKADELQHKAESLQQKLDELKNIEKAMTTRDRVKQK
jgi:hypothetical protein